LEAASAVTASPTACAERARQCMQSHYPAQSCACSWGVWLKNGADVLVENFNISAIQNFDFAVQVRPRTRCARVHDAGQTASKLCWAALCAHAYTSPCFLPCCRPTRLAL
jgi:hypothetical protein